MRKMLRAQTEMGESFFSRRGGAGGDDSSFHPYLANGYIWQTFFMDPFFVVVVVVDGEERLVLLW